MNSKLLILLVSSSLLVAASAIFSNALALAHSQTQGHHEAIAFPTALSSLSQAPLLTSHQGCSCPNCLSLSLAEAVTQLAEGEGRSLQPVLTHLKNE